MNASESAHESLATRFWSGLLLRSLRDGCDQIHVSPIADRYLVRVHDHVGWRELHVEGSPDLYDSLVPRLKALVGYPSSDPIAPPGARCVSFRSRDKRLTLILLELPPNKRLKLAARVD